LGSRAYGLGIIVWGYWFRVQGSGFRYRISSLRFRVRGEDLSVLELGVLKQEFKF
jgi:hypothetical protein